MSIKRGRKMLKKMNDLLAGVPATLAGGVFLVLSFVLPRAGVNLPVDPAWITVIISGIPLLYLAIWRIIYNTGISKISSALLISIAMIAAIAIGDLFAAGEVAFIMAIGAILEDMTTERAKKGLKKLISLAPTQGRKIVNGNEVMISADEIKKEDILRILPGETIPVDGIVIEGETSVDQSIMTGESIPIDKCAGEEVYCGTINRFGTIDIRATNVGEDSSFQKLIRMVQEAENNKAPMQRITDKCASWLVPVALLIAVITLMVTKNIVRAVTVLVVFCPCALVLATPTAIMAAIGQATRYGVIIKSGEALEKIGKVDTIAFDKTGTLTVGKLEVSDIVVFDNTLSENELLSLSASAESKSEHPLGRAIVAYARKNDVSIQETGTFKMESGKEKCMGVIALSDVLRPEAETMVDKLNEMKTDVVLLTGDNQNTADYFARRAGIQNVYAELLPEQKVEKIINLIENGKTVCMIGDGVNDAPALKTANVGVAMGSMGSDIAVDAADIALMSDDITKITYLKRLSDATVKTIKFSITLSMCINFLAVTCSILGILTPTTGALVHNAGSCFVVLIAALLYDRNLN